MTSEHRTYEQLQMLVDGSLSSHDAMTASEHLRHCEQCNARYHSMLRLDRALTRLPLQRVGSDFTRSVLRKLNISPNTSFLFRIVENLAYLFGLMIVLGIMLTAFIITGAISSDDISNTQTVARNITGTITSTINRPIAWLTSSLQSYLPFVFGTGSLKIAVTGTLIVGILALLDRFLKRKFVR